MNLSLGLNAEAGGHYNRDHGECQASASRGEQRTRLTREDAHLKIGQSSPLNTIFFWIRRISTLNVRPGVIRFFKARRRRTQNWRFVQFNMGLAYLKKREYKHARDECLTDKILCPISLATMASITSAGPSAKTSPPELLEEEQ
jgi:hypothetical protein